MKTYVFRVVVEPDGRRVTVTFHSPGQTFSMNVLQWMIQDQAQWTEADLRRLDLL